MSQKMERKSKPENDQPQIEISCPHCGGASSWGLLQTLNQCTYCGSVLSWPYPEGEPNYLIAESAIQNDSDLLHVLAMYDAMREASRRRGAMRQSSGDSELDISFDLGAGFTDTAIYDIKRQRIHLFRILKSFCVYVPYQLVSSLLVFHVLGRVANDQKVFQSLFFTSEAILPGYSGEWNFRDRGLQLSKQKLKLLAGSMPSERFIATGPVINEIEKVTRQWTGNRKIFEAEIQPICFEGKALESHRWWVYRPYYFVNAQTPQGTTWFLVDGQFGTIAGTPTTAELNQITRGNWKKLNLRTVRMCDIRVIPFRCPNCGWDVKLKKGIYQICDNCTRLLEVNPDGLKLVSYATLPAHQIPWWPKQHRGPKVWLPFWRVELSLLFENKTYEDLTQLMSVLIPGVKKNSGRNQLYIPAFECWPVAKYDRWAFEFGFRLGESDGSHCEMTLHNVKSSSDVVIPPVVSGDLLPALFPQIVAMYTSGPMQARLNTLLINRLAKMRVQLKSRELVFIPAALLESRGTDPRLQGPKQSIEWMPMKEGVWPPMLQRSVRRWKAMGQHEAKETAPKSRLKWLGSALNKRL